MAGNSVCYASTADLAMLGLPDNVLVVDAPVVQAHLEDASALIDTYLRSQYKLPIKVDTGGSYPRSLRNACVVLASYSLIQYIGYNPNNSDAHYESRYHDMVGNPNVSGSSGWLDKLASGSVSLDIDADATPGTSEGAPMVSTQPERGWNLDASNRPNTKFI